MHAKLMFLREQQLYGSCCYSLLVEEIKHSVCVIRYHLVLIIVKAAFIQFSLNKMTILPLLTPVFLNSSELFCLFDLKC